MFKESVKATLEEGIQQLDQSTVDVIEQCYLDSIHEAIKGRMKNDGGFKLNVGFAEFTVSPSVKDDNTNVSAKFTEDFISIVEGDDTEIMIEEEDLIEAFDGLLTHFKIKTVPGLAAGIMGMLAEGFAKTGRAHITEDKWYSLTIPRIGIIKFGLFDGETKVTFEADKELKQLVKNYGI